jgi:hypothetical protein
LAASAAKRNLKQEIDDLGTKGLQLDLGLLHLELVGVLADDDQPFGTESAAEHRSDQDGNQTA